MSTSSHLEPRNGTPRFPRWWRLAWIAESHHALVYRGSSCFDRLWGRFLPLSAAWIVGGANRVECPLPGALGRFSRAMIRILAISPGRTHLSESPPVSVDCRLRHTRISSVVWHPVNSLCCHPQTGRCLERASGLAKPGCGGNVARAIAVGTEGHSTKAGGSSRRIGSFTMDTNAPFGTDLASGCVGYWIVSKGSL